MPAALVQSAARNLTAAIVLRPLTETAVTEGETADPGPSSAQQKVAEALQQRSEVQQMQRHEVDSADLDEEEPLVSVRQVERELTPVVLFARPRAWLLSTSNCAG